MLEDAVREYPVHCPYCDAPFTLLLDISAGSDVYWEDCAVCCQPIQVAVDVALDGSLAGGTLARDDDVI